MPASTSGTRKWMHGASAPLRGALLGLVLEQPGHGGELAARLERRLGEHWRLDPTDIYRLLARLEEDGLLAAGREEGHLAKRVVYHPTDTTEDALTLWLETLVPREPTRSALQAKIAAARGERDARLLLRALEAHERECLDLARLVPPANGSASTWKGLCVECLRDGVWRQLQSEIEWARQTRQRIAEHAGYA
jgi:DNA-binding PadR family transcriptional regulator